MYTDIAPFRIPRSARKKKKGKKPFESALVIDAYLI